LRAATEAGLTPMAVLQAATRNVAAAHHNLDVLGTLERGKMADLVILNADPLEDPGAYADIDLVMKDGRVVDLGALPWRKVVSE
jgi:imidazolonepropionase-like amidohydrolase